MGTLTLLKYKSHVNSKTSFFKVITEIIKVPFEQLSKLVSFLPIMELPAPEPESEDAHLYPTPAKKRNVSNCAYNKVSMYDDGQYARQRLLTNVSTRHIATKYVKRTTCVLCCTQKGDTDGSHSRKGFETSTECELCKVRFSNHHSVKRWMANGDFKADGSGK